MDETLRKVAQKGDVEAFYALIRVNPYYLERIDEIPFVQTPLHEAAATGQTRFALEMMRLKPSFVRKPNPEGFSPLHLALQNGHTHMVLRFVEIDADLIRVKGKEGMTLLHYAAETGNLDLLAEFLRVCPKSIEDLTVRNETALHIAVKKNMFEALEVLVGWLRVGWLRKGFYKGGVELDRKKVMNWKDEEGNTVLHIATAKSSPLVVKSLVGINGVNVNAKNLKGLTALDILNRQMQLDNGEIKKILRRAGGRRASRRPIVQTPADLLRSKTSFWSHFRLAVINEWLYMSSDTRNTFLVVVVLIATATYQAALSPPGGVWQEDSQPLNYNTTTAAAMNQSIASSPPTQYAGETTLPPTKFSMFALGNSLSFYFSVGTIVFLLPRIFLSAWLVPLLLGLSFTYMWSMYLISGKGFFNFFGK